MVHTLFLQHTKMFNLYGITTEHNEEHHLKWLNIPDHRYRMLITGGSESGKTNALLNLSKEQNNVIDKIHFYAKDVN